MTEENKDLIPIEEEQSEKITINLNKNNSFLKEMKDFEEMTSLARSKEDIGCLEILLEHSKVLLTEDAPKDFKHSHTWLSKKIESYKLSMR